MSCLSKALIKKLPVQPATIPSLFISQQSKPDPTTMAARFKELLKKYGKVAVGVHFSVSAASITGLYIAIKNNVDVESLFDKWHLPGFSKPTQQTPPSSHSEGGFIIEMNGDSNASTAVIVEEEEEKKNHAAKLVASGGALTLAVLCNKALFPIRLPITVVLTPPVARFLARRKIMKKDL